MKMLRDDPRLSKAKDLNYPALFFLPIFREIGASDQLELLNLTLSIVLFFQETTTPL